MKKREEKGQEGHKQQKMSTKKNCRKNQQHGVKIVQQGAKNVLHFSKNVRGSVLKMCGMISKCVA